jgi:hypothetical protein
MHLDISVSRQKCDTYFWTEGVQKLRVEIDTHYLSYQKYIFKLHIYHSMHKGRLPIFHSYVSYMISLLNNIFSSPPSISIT